jgi:hypothetical protein
VSRQLIFLKPPTSPFFLKRFILQFLIEFQKFLKNVNVGVFIINSACAPTKRLIFFFFAKSVFDFIGFFFLSLKNFEFVKISSRCVCQISSSSNSQLGLAGNSRISIGNPLAGKVDQKNDLIAAPIDLTNSQLKPVQQIVIQLNIQDQSTFLQTGILLFIFRILLKLIVSLKA